MGDRVLVTFKDKSSNDLSPAVYMHWSGEETEQYIKDAQKYMRRGDASYAAARFCGYCHQQLSPGPIGLGLLAAKLDGITWEKYSHGDAGVYLVNVSTGEVEAYGGYGKPFKLDPDKFPD